MSRDMTEQTTRIRLLGSLSAQEVVDDAVGEVRERKNRATDDRRSDRASVSPMPMSTAGLAIKSNCPYENTDAKSMRCDPA